MARQSFDLHFLLHAADLLEGELRSRLARIDMGPRQARVLDALSRMEPTSQVRLAREFGVGAASMSTMTVRLIEAGFVMREVDPNEARAHRLRLTKAGHGMLAEIHAAWRDMDALIAERIGAERSTQLAQLTHALRDALGGHVPGTGRAGSESHPDGTS